MTQDQARDHTATHSSSRARRRTSTVLKALPLVGGLALSVLLFMDASFADEEPMPPQPAPPAGAEHEADARAPEGPERPQPPAKEDLPETLWDLMLGKYDKNADGVITKAEYTRSDKAFQVSDRNRDGVLTSADYRRPRMQRGPHAGHPQEMTPGRGRTPGGAHMHRRGGPRGPGGMGPAGRMGPGGGERGPRMHHRRGPHGDAGQRGPGGRAPMGAPGGAGPRGEDCGCDSPGGMHPQRGGPMGPHPRPRHQGAGQPMGPGGPPPAGPDSAGAPPRPEHGPRHPPVGRDQDE